MSFPFCKKLVVSLVVAFSAVAFPASAVTYLKADAPDGGDGSSWATACRNVEEAVKVASAGDHVIYAAGGLYPVTNKMAVADGFEIYGGFPGLSMEETPADRDVERHRTILTGDLGQDDFWYHVEPVFGEYRLRFTQLRDRPLFSDGALQMPPPYQGDYDCYYPFMTGKQSGQAFVVGAGVGAVFDGLWFSGFLYVKDAGADCISIEAEAKPTKVHGCRFIGNTPRGGQVADYSGKATISSCHFRFAGTDTSASGLLVSGATRVVDCLFESHARTSALQGGVIYLVQKGDAIIERCRFVRCLGATKDYGWAEGSYGGTGTVIAGAPGKDTKPDCILSDCVIANCFTASPYETGTPLVALMDGTVRRCTFLNNRYEVKPRAGRVYTIVGNAFVEDYHQLYEGCVFRGNVIAAPSVAATERKYALGILGTASGAGRMSVVNCTFDGNSVECVETPGVSVVPSRALVGAATNPTKGASLGVANCTFTGPASGGPVDIVLFGDFYIEPVNIVNSLFMATGVEAYFPVGGDRTDLFSLYDCTVQNAFEGLSGLQAFGLSGDPVPFAREEIADASPLSLLVPSAATPGLRRSSDVATNGPVVDCAATFRFRPFGSAEWQPLLPALGGIDGSEPLPMADAKGTIRPFGAYTCGAVQTLASPAEEGVSLTLRREPLLGGTLSDPSTQATTADGAIRPVTANPAEGNSFIGWFDTEGTLYSPANPLAIASLSSNLVLVARFDAPEVEVTFDLAEAGTFTENGLSKITLRVARGATFPAVPPYEEKENWLILGWDDLPPFVPAEGGLFPVKAITKDLRVVHVVPAGEVPAGSDRSGDSWANATDDLFAAYENAGLWRGEVWMKEGRYFIPYFMTARSHVAIRGGFAGTETSASEADPVAHPTVLTGDRNGDDFWRPDGKNPAEADRVAIWNGTAFTEPNPDGLDEYWDLNGNAGDNTDQFLRDNINAPAAEVVLDGVTITCFGSAAIELRNPGADLTMRRCRFLANAAKCVSQYANPRGKSALLCVDARLRAEDCAFIGNHRAVDLSVSTKLEETAGNVPVFLRCLFRENTSTEDFACLKASERGVTCVDCRFVRNRAVSPGIANSVIRLPMPHEGTAAFTNCLFQENRGTRSAYAVMEMGRGHLILERCHFIGNELLGAKDNYYHSACVMSTDWGHVRARNSYFASNRLEVASFTAERAYGTVAVSMINPMAFLNCTIVDNVSSNGAGDAIAVGTFSSCSSFALVNTLVDGSRFDGNCADFVFKPRLPDTSFTMVNTVVRNETPGYEPFAILKAGPLNLANCAISGFAPETIDTGDDGCLYDVTAIPGPVSFTKKGPAGELARGIAPSSPYARAGRLVVDAPDGVLYYRDDLANPSKPWRSCSYRTHFKVTVPGFDAETEPTPPADAFGAPRVEGRIAYGPLNVAPGGTIMLLR